MSEHQRRKPAGKQPISRHPLFPAIVALWFGALFGIGSILVHPEVIERAVLAARIDSVIPMAAPPLGTTTRILLALAMTGVGGLLGALLGRRIARPPVEHRERRRRSKPVQTERRSVTSDRSFVGKLTDADETEGSRHPAGRRRALALQDEDLPRESQEYAPLPGRAPQILDLSGLNLDDDVDGDNDATPAFLGHTPPGDDVAFEAELAVTAAEPGFASFKSQTDLIAPERIPGVQMFIPDPDVEQPESDAVEANFAEVAAPAVTTGIPGAMRLFESYSGSIAAKAGGEPTDEYRESLLSRSFDAHTAAQPVPLGQIDFAHIDATSSVAEETTTAALAGAVGPDESRAPIDATAAERIASSELDQLSHVELLERLAIAMAERRSQVQAEPFTPEPTSEAEPNLAQAGFGADPQTPQAETASADVPIEGEIAPPPLMRLPAALRPVSLDHDEDNADALPGYIPPRHIGIANTAETSAPASDVSGQNTAAVDEQWEAEPLDGELLDEDGVLQEGYSSLLGLSLPAAAKVPYVRIDEPEPVGVQPVVRFPGDAAVEDTVAPFGQAASAMTRTAVLAPPSAGPSAPVGYDERRFDAPGVSPPVAVIGGADTADTERALRAALATLQRMSGAA